MKKMISWNVNAFVPGLLGKDFRIFKGDRRRYLLHPGELQEAQVDLGSSWISPILELCGEKRYSERRCLRRKSRSQ